jgi:hypothetical protein
LQFPNIDSAAGVHGNSRLVLLPLMKKLVEMSFMLGCERYASTVAVTDAHEE